MVESLATIYIKKPFHVVAGSDGIEEAFAGCLLPPYIIPTQYWLKTRVMSEAEAASLELQPYTMSGRIGDFPRGFITDADPPSAGLQLLTDLMEEFLAHEPGSVGDGIQDTQQDVNLPGSGVVGIRSQEFFRRDMWMGLPKNGLVTDVDQFRHVDYFSTGGKIANKMVGNYDQGTIIGFGITTEAFEVQAQSDDALLGGPAAATPQLDVILTEILDKIEANTAGDTPVLFNTGMGDAALLNSQALQWQTGAYGTEVAGDKSLRVNSIITVRCEVRIPQYSEHLVIRG